MNHNTFTTIGSIIIFGLWFYIAYTSVKAYRRLLKRKNVSPFMTRQQLQSITDPETVAEIKAWNRLSKRLFVVWVITGFGYVLLAMIINKTIGFKH